MSSFRHLSALLWVGNLQQQSGPFHYDYATILHPTPKSNLSHFPASISAPVHLLFPLIVFGWKLFVFFIFQFTYQNITTQCRGWVCDTTIDSAYLLHSVIETIGPEQRFSSTISWRSIRKWTTVKQWLQGPIPQLPSLVSFHSRKSFLLDKYHFMLCITMYWTMLQRCVKWMFFNNCVFMHAAF